MLNQKQLNELSVELSIFSESPVSLNWYSKRNKSTAIMSIDHLDALISNNSLCMGETLNSPILHIDMNGIINFKGEMSRLNIETEDINYIIETV